jgi:hypothetical protein
MTATKMMVKTTPPTTPPITGARGNLLPPSAGLLCIKAVGEDGLLDWVVEVVKIRFVAVV